MRTRDKLAAELRKVAAQASPDHAAKYEAFAKRAATGEFDDFGEKYTCPITQLHNELSAAEWARSPAGQDVAKQLSPELRRLLGMDLNN